MLSPILVVTSDIPHPSGAGDFEQTTSAVSFLDLRRAGPILLRRALVANSRMGENHLCEWQRYLWWLMVDDGAAAW